MKILRGVILNCLLVLSINEQKSHASVWDVVSDALFIFVGYSSIRSSITSFNSLKPYLAHGRLRGKVFNELKAHFSLLTFLNPIAITVYSSLLYNRLRVLSNGLSVGNFVNALCPTFALLGILFSFVVCCISLYGIKNINTHNKKI